VILVAGVLAPLWWTGDPLEMKPRGCGCGRRRPNAGSARTTSAANIYTRTLYGSRISLTVGAAVSTLSLVLGTTLGLVRRLLSEARHDRHARHGRAHGHPRPFSWPSR